MKVARLIVDPPQPGDWNMAVDEALLHSAAEGQTTLRLYEWAEPTLSLGYFQSYRERELHAASRSCPCVRRTSGGGAILHDRELTYSFTMPLAQRWAANVQSVYLSFHEMLVAALARWGLAARLCDPPAREAVAPESQPFLCFQRRVHGDVLLGNAKICGSAQRRHRGALLQHGSVILKRSTNAPEIQGIEELSGQAMPCGELASAWFQGLESRLGVGWRRAELAPLEQRAAEGIRSRKFASGEWLVRR